MVSRLRAHFEKLAAIADIRLDGDRPWDIVVHDERMFQRVLAHGTLGLGEAYVDGWWDCDQLDELVRRAQSADLVRHLISPTTIARVARARVMKANLDAHWDELSASYDARFKRMWDFYLLASAGSFRARKLQLWQFVMSRDGVPHGYHAENIR